MEIKYNVKIQIDTIDLGNGLLAFKWQKTTKGNKEISTSWSQGIATKEELEKINDFGEFKSSAYRFWTKEFMELHRACPHNDDYMTAFTMAIINNPYDIAQQGNWQEKYVLARHNSSSEDFITVDGKYLPKALYVSYLEGMDNSNYDLEKVLKEIKKMDNIICLSDKIERIPYYNAEESRDQQIKFIFTPTQEQYQQYCQCSPFQRTEKAIKLLGLDKYKKN